MEILCSKREDGAFVPFGEEASEASRRFKPGQQVWLSIRIARNNRFHKKFFALLNLVYDIWSEANPTIELPDGGEARINFDRWRKDLIILAGYWERIPRIDGSMTVEAQSIAFHAMNEETFEKLYSDVIDTIVQKLLPKRFTAQSLRDAVDQVLEFA